MSQGLKIGHALQGGTYRIEKVLGQGSFGITYLAAAKFTREGNLGSMAVEARVAVKEFFMSDVNSRRSDGSTVEGSSGSVFTNYRRRFRKEAENLAGLSHPGIVKVLDVFDENNTTYYVMEYIDGTDLDEYIRRNGPLPEDEAVAAIKEIGEALAYMHSCRMLHLDIKPKNIMRKAVGGYSLIDFGLSKHFNDNGEPDNSTSIGLGTPGYAPVEQSGYKEDGSFPATLDIYALGATLFKMLTGKRPPEATYVLNEGFPDATLRESAVSPHNISVISKAMAPLKRNRYQTVSAFLNYLGNAEEEDTTVIDAEPAAQPSPEPEPNPEPQPNPKPTSKPAPTPKPEPNPNTTPKANPTTSPKPELGPSKRKWYYIGGVALTAIIVSVIIGISNGRTTPETPIPSPVVEERFVEERSDLDPVIENLISNMVYVEGGSFMMGSDDSDAFDDEKPAHRETVGSFSIGKYEVTQKEWEVVMGSNLSEFKGDDFPVENVSWDDCQEFIRKLNAKTGKNFRLPTESEWEYAARGGNRSQGFKYSGSNDIGSVAWYDGNSGDKTHPVGTKSANELGLYDMSGNVWEWTSDKWCDDYNSPRTSPDLVCRGGCWDYTARYCRVSHRNYFGRADCNDYLGLRLAL